MFGNINIDSFKLISTFIGLLYQFFFVIKIALIVIVDVSESIQLVNQKVRGSIPSRAEKII